MKLKHEIKKYQIRLDAKVKSMTDRERGNKCMKTNQVKVYMWAITYIDRETEGEKHARPDQEMGQMAG